MEISNRVLGRTGLTVPALGLGCAGIGGDVTDSEAVETLAAAFDAGIRYVDTSPLYGQSERRVGLGLRGVARSSFVLSTKTGTHPDRRHDYSRDATLWSVDNSLRLLGIDFIDLLLVHDPPAIEPIFAPGAALDTLDELRAQGVIGAIGLGQRNHAWHRQAIDSGRVDVILTYNDFHPLRTTADALLDHATTAGVGVLNGSPLGLGLLAADLADPSVRDRFAWQPREAQIGASYQAFCRSRGISPIAAALQFSLREPRLHCTLTGAKTPIELAENLAAIAAPIPEGFWDELAAQGFTDGQV